MSGPDWGALRPTFRTDQETSVRDGQPFTIIGMGIIGAEELGGDHPEPRFVIRYPDGGINDDVNPECIFEGFDPHFDEWCKDFPE